MSKALIQRHCYILKTLTNIRFWGIVLIVIIPMHNALSKWDGKGQMHVIFFFWQPCYLSFHTFSLSLFSSVIFIRILLLTGLMYTAVSHLWFLCFPWFSHLILSCINKIQSQSIGCNFWFARASLQKNKKVVLIRH